jgi:hypothetical protein
VILPDPAEAALALAAVEGAFESGGGPDPLQRSVLAVVARDLYGLGPEDLPPPLPADEFLATGATPTLCQSAVSLMVILEMLAHPLRPEVAESVTTYARRLGVTDHMVGAARALAEDQLRSMYEDIQRSTWFHDRTVHGALHGRFLEVVRSRLAYKGVVASRSIAAKWTALGRCPAGSWGRGVADFYQQHQFPFPGQLGGMREVAATHDFIHVLAEYDATPAGEIEVFAFIGASMPEQWGLAMLCFTLGIFQNGSIRVVEGKPVAIARADTLSDPGNVDRFGEALARGRATTVDVLGGVDHFALAHVDLDEIRHRFHVEPRRTSDR